MDTITIEMFKRATGQDPIQDDMARCNCPDAGKDGHKQCGWCKEKNLPRFLCQHCMEKTS
jgi:hypothetical protein